MVVEMLSMITVTQPKWQMANSMDIINNGRCNTISIDTYIYYLLINRSLGSNEKTKYTYSTTKH